MSSSDNGQSTATSSADHPQSDEKATPRSFFDPLDQAVGGFDLDPAAGAEPEPLADTRYTIEDDGLNQEWHGTVWLNPPFSDMRPWIQKIVSEVVTDRVDTVVLLCKGDSSTRWWQKAAEAAELVTAVDHRLQFVGTDYAAPFAIHVMVFGDVPDPLRDALQEQGLLGRFISEGTYSG